MTLTSLPVTPRLLSTPFTRPCAPNRNALLMTSEENDVNVDKGVMTKLTATPQERHSQNHDGSGFVHLLNLHLLHAEHRTCDSLRDLLS